MPKTIMKQYCGIRKRATRAYRRSNLMSRAEAWSAKGVKMIGRDRKGGKYLRWSLREVSELSMITKLRKDNPST
jgi:hypothetical protein